jgi:pilus assembly protein CpaB
VFGIGLAVLTFVLIVALLPSAGGPVAQPSPTPVVNVQVVVATTDIPLGTVVTADMLSTSTVPVSQAKPGYFASSSLVVGSIARQGIVSGEQLSNADFSTDQAQIKVPAGRRALAVSVNELTGVGNLIYPGDWVDVVITLDKAAIPVVVVQPGPPTTTQAGHDDALAPVTVKASALLQNIQVLGTLEAPLPAPAASPQASQGPAFSGTTVQKLVILAVTDDQAEAILFARYFDQAGTTDATGATATINLILRSTDDASAPPINTSGVDLRTMFDKYGVVPPYIQKAIDAFIAQQQP